MHEPALDRRMLDKLIREITRAESQAMEHHTREERRLGAEAPPVIALRDVANHAAAMRPRFFEVLNAHEIRAHKHGLGATLATLRHLVVDRVVDPERSFRTALLDLRHGIDVVKLLRELARRDILFGVIRWCDDWLGARRTLVARVEAQLRWFSEQDDVAIAIDRVPATAPALSPFGEPAESSSRDSDPDDWHADRTT